jgi:hypothetical protein
MYFRIADLTSLAPRSVALLLVFGVMSSGATKAADLLSTGSYQQPSPVSSGWEYLDLILHGPVVGLSFRW